ncbi:MAG: hypothetical protein JXR96_16820 [Deltaproteobacteria bacterium]|nr:hypothetical protein [Deltaproteobacteria bacterium]
MSRTLRTLCAVSLLVLPATALAGLAPIEQVGKAARLQKRPRLQVEQDEIAYEIGSSHVRARQRLVLVNPGKAVRALLGLPLATSSTGPQGLRVKQQGPDRAAPLKTRRLRSSEPKAAAWQAVEVRLPAGKRVEIEAEWWQPHAEEELYGYPRNALRDPLWSAGAFAGPAARLERSFRLEPGVEYSSCQPECPPAESGLRRLVREGSQPGPAETLAIFYKRQRGASSPCQGGQPWQALDGDAQTAFEPASCPAGQAFLDLVADCDGFGTGSPNCTRAAGARFDIGISVRTADGKRKVPVQIEGWWGPGKRWSKRGRSNEPIPIQQREPVTHYRVLYPQGMPSGGSGEIQLARADLADSDEGAQKILRAQGWVRAPDSCTFMLLLYNPVNLSHVTLRLKPRSKPRKEWAVYTKCANKGSTLVYHEPFPHKHSKKKIAELGLDTSFLDGMEEHEHHGHDHHTHFKRKHPDRIELDLSPECIETQIKVYSPFHGCTLPRLDLVY